jgi:signal transduction histidine kinase
MSALHQRFGFVLALFVGVFVPAGPASALDPDTRMEDYNHTVWTAKDGVPAEIVSMAQTPDGWLWLGTLSGLFRFVGVRFERYSLPGKVAVRRNRITQVHAEPNGDLWIAYAVSGLSVLHNDGTIDDLADSGRSVIGPGGGTGPISAIAIDVDGSVWAGALGGIYHYVKGVWNPVATEEEWAVTDGRSVVRDQYDRIWAANMDHVYLLDRTTGKFEKVNSPNAGGSVIISPDGRIWAAGRARVELLDIPPPTALLPRPDFANRHESRWGGQFDRDGNLWSLKCPKGLCVINARHIRDRKGLRPSADHTHEPDQRRPLSSPGVNALLEDREGNIWVATQGGLERFRGNKLISARLPVSGSAYSMARDADGAIWASESDTARLWKLTANSVEPLVQKGSYTVVATDRDGALLLAGKRSIERRYHGQVSQIPLPFGANGQPQDMSVVGLLDDGKVLWMVAAQTGLMGWENGRWSPRKSYNLPSSIFFAAAGKKGQLWLSDENAVLSLYEDERLTSYDASAIGLTSGIFSGDEVVVCGDKGMGVLQHQTLQQIQAADPEVLQNISGLIVTADGDRWFNGGKGIVHVRHEDWQAALLQPEHPLRYELLNVLEGYPGRATLDNRLPTAVMGGDGQLWFRATGGVVRFDPDKASRNVVPPVVEIQRVNTPLAAYTAGTRLMLPAGSQAFNIQFTAPGLRRPEGIQFQYRLFGVDQAWQSTGAQRAAFYTNVGPGDYRFSVRAVNEDGIRSAQEATMELQIAPTIQQSSWFKILCVFALLLLLLGAYRYRLKVVYATLANTAAVRLKERERIARTLHDTILQSVQTIILRLHFLGDDLPKDSEIRTRLLALLDRADMTVSRGRDQVHGLRTNRDGDIAALITEAAQMLGEHHPSIRFELAITGFPQRLQEGICDEIGEIVLEALRNAFRHSDGSLVEVSLHYSPLQLIVQVVDDGKGIDADVLSNGRSWHWGLVGMEERATRIGAKFHVKSEVGQGTVIKVAISADHAYLPRERRSMLATWRDALFAKRPSTHRTQRERH